MYCFNKKCFTLAEIMIALTIIGVITAILLPVAIQITPSEKVMKFKKANATLARVINELVTSGEYYTPGDLGVKPDGTLVDSATYLCKTIADILAYKSINCSDTYTDYWEGIIVKPEIENNENWNAKKINIDKYCADTTLNLSSEIITTDNITFYQTNSAQHFGINSRTYFEDSSYIESYDERLFGRKKWINLYGTNRGSDVDPIYKVFCIDIDGIGKGEDPFGYGIRADGKIILGARAQAWLEKGIQDKE